LDVIGALNFGPHTHAELSGPSLELITIFEKFGQNCQKLGESLWGLTVPRYISTTPYFCISLQTADNAVSFVKF